MNNATAWQAGKGKGTGCQHQLVPTLPGTGCIVDPSYCNFDSILEAQASGMAVFVRFRVTFAACFLLVIMILDHNQTHFDPICRTMQLYVDGICAWCVQEARGPCIPSETCLAAYLAAAEPGTYIHCTYNGDDLLNATT